MTAPALNREFGRRMKEQGQDIAADHAGAEWMSIALNMIRQYADLMGCTGWAVEEYREWALRSGLPEPSSPNVWGSLARIARTRGYIVGTGEYRPARSIRTHHHPVKIWRAA